MELKVTQKNCNRMEVGQTFIVKGQVIPAWAVGKVEVIGDAEPEEPKEMVVNPENGGQPVAQTAAVGDGASGDTTPAPLTSPVGAPEAPVAPAPAAPEAPAPAAPASAAPASAKAK